MISNIIQTQNSSQSTSMHVISSRHNGQGQYYEHSPEMVLSNISDTVPVSPVGDSSLTGMSHSKNGYTSPSDSILTPLEVGQSIITTQSQSGSDQLFAGVQENWASPGTLAQPVQSPVNRSLHTTCCTLIYITRNKN